MSYWSNEGEVWKDIEGYEGNYQVSNLGRIRKCKLMIIHKRDKQYIHLGLNKNGKIKNFMVHRLVAKAFVPGYFRGAVVNHKDGNKENNNFDNLEWCTIGDNTRHAYRMGLIPPAARGENHVSSKLVLNFETGIFFYSATEAANAHCLNRITLCGMLTGHDRNKTAMHYV